MAHTQRVKREDEETNHNKKKYTTKNNSDVMVPKINIWSCVEAQFGFMIESSLKQTKNASNEFKFKPKTRRIVDYQIHTTYIFDQCKSLRYVHISI